MSKQLTCVALYLMIGMSTGDRCVVWELAGASRRVSESCKDSSTGEHAGASETGIIVWIPVGCCQQLGSIKPRDGQGESYS